jgi:hypothetical protein
MLLDYVKYGIPKESISYFSSSRFDMDENFNWFLHDIEIPVRVTHNTYYESKKIYPVKNYTEGIIFLN